LFAPSGAAGEGLAMVFTPEDSGLLAELLPDFEEQTGHSVLANS
jgi:ABC-type tungstate transport system permease subunit